jgi:hypothetical protein
LRRSPAPRAASTNSTAQSRLDPTPRSKVWIGVPRAFDLPALVCDPRRDAGAKVLEQRQGVCPSAADERAGPVRKASAQIRISAARSASRSPSSLVGIAKRYTIAEDRPRNALEWKLHGALYDETLARAFEHGGRNVRAAGARLHEPKIRTAAAAAGLPRPPGRSGTGHTDREVGIEWARTRISMLSIWWRQSLSIILSHCAAVTLSERRMPKPGPRATGRASTGESCSTSSCSPNLRPRLVAQPGQRLPVPDEHRRESLERIFLDAHFVRQLHETAPVWEGSILPMVAVALGHLVGPVLGAGQPIRNLVARNARKPGHDSVRLFRLAPGRIECDEDGPRVGSAPLLKRGSNGSGRHATKAMSAVSHRSSRDSRSTSAARERRSP